MKLALKEDIYRIDRECAEKYGIPALLLMENAGGAAFGAIKELIPEYKSKKFLILCGPGNNGGDGAVLARRLFSAGISVQVFFTGPMGKSSPEALTNFSIIEKTGVNITNFPFDFSILIKSAEQSDILIDAIFGIGFRGEPDEFTARIIDFINSSGKTVLSLDIPSGLQADGKAASHSIRAGYTVTFGLPKLGMADFPGRELAGKIVTDPLSIPRQLLGDPSIKNNLITLDDIHAVFSPRKRDTNKGTYGHLLLAGGSVSPDSPDFRR